MIQTTISGTALKQIQEKIVLILLKIVKNACLLLMNWKNYLSLNYILLWQIDRMRDRLKIHLVRLVTNAGNLPTPNRGNLCVP